MTNPEKNYHLEWIAVDETLAQSLDKVLEKTEIRPHTQTRRGQTVVYLKSAQQIVDVLAMMGANQAVMDMENVRIMRQLRGQANRAANCDMHNTEKTINASEEQIRAISRIMEKQGLDSLPPALRQIAKLRLDNVDASLEELGQKLKPAIGKSGVNHRMRRLIAIAESLEE